MGNMGRKKKGFNWKAREQNSKGVLDEDANRKLVNKLDGANFVKKDPGNNDDTNHLILPSKSQENRIKKKLSSEAPKKILSKKKRKELEKVLENKRKKSERAEILEKLASVQIKSSILDKMTSISAVQT